MRVQQRARRRRPGEGKKALVENEQRSPPLADGGDLADQRGAGQLPRGIVGIAEEKHIRRAGARQFAKDLAAEREVVFLAQDEFLYLSAGQQRGFLVFRKGRRAEQHFFGLPGQAEADDQVGGAVAAEQLPWLDAERAPQRRPQRAAVRIGIAGVGIDARDQRFAHRRRHAQRIEVDGEIESDVAGINVSAVVEFFQSETSRMPPFSERRQAAQGQSAVILTQRR